MRHSQLPQSSPKLALLPLIAVLGMAWGQVVAQSPATEAPPKQRGTAEQKGDASKSTGPAPTDQEEQGPGEEWVRVLADDKGKPVAMQTAIVRYRSKPDVGKPAVEVDLVGAVHVGDTAYYDDLNQRFESYDALLYELVAPEGTRIEPGQQASSRHALGAMQNAMKNMLQLEHQLEKIDYTKENFVHADMSPEEFLKTMKERGESFLQMYFRLVGQSIAMQSQMSAKGKSADAEMMAALFSEDRPRLLKIAMAKQLSEMESLLTAFGGEDGSTIITGRNQKALAVLRKQLDEGKVRIGIFYGAGHLKDMHERLEKEFDMQPVKVTWLTAWDLTPKKAP